MSAESEIRRRIQEHGEHGKITFAEFLSVAMYWPHGGYYTGREPVGAQGDYYTSPAVHPAFGALLAVQLFQMWREMDCPSPFTVLELGAGNGLLCRDIAAYAKELPQEFAAALRYVCLDRRTPDPIEKEIPGTDRVMADGLPFQGIQGCILSNEYLDAIPVHQVTMTADGLQEVFVSVKGEDLVEVLGEPSDTRLAGRLEDLGITLAEGQTAEISLDLERWTHEVTGALERGYVLTIDYGRTAPDLYDPEARRRGTLVTYHQHVQTDAPLTMIGRQDITAQVDFTATARAGEKANLATLGLVTQREFLSNLQLGILQQHLNGHSLSPRQLQANRAGILDLARPGGLGDFKVLIQAKGMKSEKLWGLEQSDDCSALVEGLPAPLLTGQHLSLPDGRYSGGETEFEAFWPLPDAENPPQ
jgi:SAM-dependent MidA family methyltransferase